MNLIKAIFTVINMFVYIIGMFGIFIYGIYEVWYGLIIFFGILIFIICKFRDIRVFFYTIGIAISNYLSYSYFKNAPGVDGGFGGLTENTEHIIIAGWFLLLTIFLVICLIVRINRIDTKKEEYKDI